MTDLEIAQQAEMQDICEVAASLGLTGADRKAEISLVERDLNLAVETGCKLCIQHISAAESVDLLREARKKNPGIHGEATPHHFTLTEAAVLKYGANARMNPPLRTEEDRMAVIRGLQDGTIDMIVTDHAPHSREEKEKPLSSAPSGIIGLETSLGLGIASLVKPGYLTLMQLLERMSGTPAAVYGRRPGRIQAGEDADLVIFSENEEWTVDQFASKSTNSPFLGWKLPGKICYTICRGEVVYENENWGIRK